MKTINLKWWELALLMALAGLSSAIFSDLAHAGTTMENLSKTTEIIDIDKWTKLKLAEQYIKIEEQRKEAEKASQKALSKEDVEKIRAQAEEVIASSALESLRSLRNAVKEQRAFKDEIILHLSLNKRHGNFLTDFDVLRLKQFAERGMYKDAVEYMDNVIEARASSPIGASVVCSSEVTETISIRRGR